MDEGGMIEGAEPSTTAKLADRTAAADKGLVF
jgi:hypothetical protein